MIAAQDSRPIFVLFAAISLCGTLPCLAQDRWAPLGHPDAKMLGSLSCASASCHGSQDESLVPSRISRREYALWLEDDPHAKAIRTIQSKDFERILYRLAGKDAAARTTIYKRCASCHDPAGFAAAPAHPEMLQPENAQTFSCESCHGAAEHWLARHYEAGISRQELRDLGMIDTKDPLVRARQCVSCHVGDDVRDMNHDMIAAGHPPLRFEISAYHDLIRRKHWSDRERIENPHFKAHLWAAGQVAAAEATAALLESRAAGAAADCIAATSGRVATPWPEFAEYDCFACHQRLRPQPSGSTVALKAATPGIPGWQPWNLALTERVLGGDAADRVATLRRRLGGSLDPDPAETERLAGELRRSIRQITPEHFSAAQIVELVQADLRQGQSWATSTQQLLALQAAYLAWRDETRKLSPAMQLVAHGPSCRYRAPDRSGQTASGA
jgi:hypothetical protein